MVNDDIERLHRFGSQLKQIQPPQQNIKDNNREKQKMLDPLNSRFVSFLKNLKRIYKQKKVSFSVFLSYQMNCFKMKKLKKQSPKKNNISHYSVRLVEKKYQIFNRTVLIRQRKRIYQSESNQRDEHHPKAEKQQSLANYSSNLFDVPVADE